MFLYCLSEQKLSSLYKVLQRIGQPTRSTFNLVSSSFRIFGMLHLQGFDVQGNSSSLSVVVPAAFLHASSIANKVAAR